MPLKTQIECPHCNISKLIFTDIRRVYDLGENLYLRMMDTPVWCEACEDFSPGEFLPNEAELLSNKDNFAKNGEMELYESLSKLLKNRKSGPRCLLCSSTKIDHKLEIHQPCKNKLKVNSSDGLLMSYETTFYDIEGILKGKENP